MIHTHPEPWPDWRNRDRDQLRRLLDFDLVGKQLSPRIRDLGKITRYRADFEDRYPLAGRFNRPRRRRPFDSAATTST
ncbi:hypothetical protein [Micromonospora lupini]|uniref:hypothetical protein n=1 Tax=Micromonospora lupini TaxID=285679 RepID=UPI0031D07734